MVGILVSFWNGLFSGAMLVLGRVSKIPSTMVRLEKNIWNILMDLKLRSSYNKSLRDQNVRLSLSFVVILDSNIQYSKRFLLEFPNFRLFRSLVDFLMVVDAPAVLKSN